MHRRPEEKHHGGLWEFPGGKVETGENPPQALIREIGEELGIVLSSADLSPAGFAQESLESSARPIVILLYRCARWEGEPQALDGGAIDWFTPQEVALLDKPPLDVSLASALFQKMPD